MIDAGQRRVIQAEQLRLVLDGIALSLPVGMILPTLLFVVLSRSLPQTALAIWYVSALAIRATLVAFARKARLADRDQAGDLRVGRLLMAFKIAEGTNWGILLWLGLPVKIPAISILLISLMAAICGNGVSLLSPLVYLYLGLALPLLSIVSVAFWSLGGPFYHGLAAFSLLYVAGQYGQVKVANRRVRDGIALRYENLDLVDRLRAESDLARLAREDAERANAAKSHFLAAASHDLRQPIHALGLFLQALRQTSLDAAQRRMVDSAKAASIASADMLNTLLDFSRLEAGVVTPKPIAFPLQPLLDKLENELAPLADEKQIAYRCNPVNLTLCSDPILLELILRNLILNAIRYTQSGGVLIGCRHRAENVWIEIYDTGIGIPPDQHEVIFQEFRQLGNPERDRHKGLGLGLAIVRGLATTLNHDIALSSVEGRGSVFRLCVPEANTPALGPDRPAPIEGNNELAGKTVLVIDDDVVVRDAMMSLVSSWKARGWAVESWQEVTGNPSSVEPPDVIVCDYRLRANETGAHAIEYLRRFWDKPVPAVLVTGDTAPERLREAAASSIPLLHKPVSSEDLYKVLASLVNHSVASPCVTPSGFGIL